MFVEVGEERTGKLHRERAKDDREHPGSALRRPVHTGGIRRQEHRSEADVVLGAVEEPGDDEGGSCDPKHNQGNRRRAISDSVAAAVTKSTRSMSGRR